MIGIGQFDHHLGVMVAAARSMFARAPAATRLTEKAGEEVAEFRRVAVGTMGAVTGKLEARTPVRRWLKFLAGAVTAAGLVISRAFLRVGQHRIGLVNLLHARFSVRFLADVRMVFTRLLAVGFLDFLRGRSLCNIENLVVIPEFHLTCLLG